jgi:hypothetical protein
VGSALYEWYENTVPSTVGGTSTGITTSTFTPNTSGLSPGSYYYYAILSFIGNDCNNDTSNVAHIEILNDPVSTDPTLMDTVCQTSPTDDSACDSLITTPSGGIGNYIYQWYSIDPVGSSTFILIAGANDSSYVPESDQDGVFEYFCVITQDPSSSGCSDTTETATVIVNIAPDATISNADDSICVDGIISPLVVIPSGPSPFVFEWHQIINSVDIPVGTNSDTYQPITSGDGVFEYYCNVIFSTGGCDSVESNHMTLVIMPDPEILIQPLADDTICEGGSIALALEISSLPGTGVGSALYEWYENTVPSTV